MKQIELNDREAEYLVKVLGQILRLNKSSRTKQDHALVGEIDLITGLLDKISNTFRTEASRTVNGTKVFSVGCLAQGLIKGHGWAENIAVQAAYCWRYGRLGDDPEAVLKKHKMHAYKTSPIKVSAELAGQIHAYYAERVFYGKERDGVGHIPNLRPSARVDNMPNIRPSARSVKKSRKGARK